MASVESGAEVLKLGIFASTRIGQQLEIAKVEEIDGGAKLLDRLGASSRGGSRPRGWRQRCRDDRYFRCFGHGEKLPARVNDDSPATWSRTRNMTVTEALTNRRAVPSFDSSVSIPTDELLALIDKANLAPSSMNMQPWEFLIAYSAEEKALLRSVAMNQPKIETASAVLVVLGNLRQWENAPRVVQAAIDSGVYTEDRREGAIAAPKNFWEPNPGLARDEVFRGCSLWSMAFMLAAMEAGWDTAPMSGFWPDKLAEAFGLPESIVPIMIICVGKRNPETSIYARGLRFAAAEISHFGRYGAHLVK